MVDPELWDGRLLTGDEYFDEETRKNAIRVDGHYAGNEITEMSIGISSVLIHVSSIQVGSIQNL